MLLIQNIKTFVFRSLIFSLLGLFLFACQEQNRSDENQALQEKKTLSFSKKINVPKRNTALLPEAKKATSKWLAYIAAQSEINSFKKYSVQEAMGNASTVQQIMTKLQKTVPDVFRTKPIIARLNKLVTLSNVLRQKASYPNITAAEVEKTARKIPVGFEDLKVQLNEVFRKSFKDFELDLDKRMDSIEMQKSQNDTLLLPTPN